MGDSAQFILELVDKVSGAAGKMGASLDQVSGFVEHAIGGIAKLNTSLDRAGGMFSPVVELGERMSGALAPIAGAAGAAGAAIVDMAEKSAAAVLGLTAAVAGLVIGMAALAIKVGEGREKSVAAFAALAGGAAQGKIAQKAVADLREQFGITRAELKPWAQSLLAAGVPAEKLAASLKAVAAANALIEGGGDKVTQVLARLTEAGMAGSKIKFSTAMLVGTSVSEAELMKALGMTPKMLELAKKQGKLTGQQIADAIVKVLGEKGAGPLAAQANRITNIWAKFKEDVVKLLVGVTESPGYKSFVAGLKNVLGIFKESSPAAKAMHAGIVGAFNAIFSAAAKVLPYVKKGIELAIIAVLRAVIAFKAWRKEGSQFGQMALVFKLVASEVKLAATTIYNFAAGLATVLMVGVRVIALGKAISDGLAKGISAGIPGAVAAVHNLGSAVIGALKATLAIASPSKVFAQLGAHTAAGFQAGIQGGSGGVKAASAGMAAGALQGAAGAAGKPGAPGGGSAKGPSVTVNVMSGAIQLAGGQGKGGAELTEIALNSMIERIVLSQGLGGAGG